MEPSRPLWWRDEGALPSVAALSMLAGYSVVPGPGSCFVTRSNPRGPQCVEYTHRAGTSRGSRRLGALPLGSRVVAREVAAAFIPADRVRDIPAEWGIAILTDSRLAPEPGSEAWINVTRGKTRFANLVTQLPTDVEDVELSDAREIRPEDLNRPRRRRRIS